MSPALFRSWDLADYHFGDLDCGHVRDADKETQKIEIAALKREITVQELAMLFKGSWSDQNSRSNL